MLLLLILDSLDQLGALEKHLINIKKLLITRLVGSHFINQKIVIQQSYLACPNPVGKYLFKVSKITLEQRYSNVILLTVNRYLPTG